MRGNLLKNPLAFLGLLLLISVTIFCFLGPLVVSGDTMAMSPNRYAPPGQSGLLGTDELGRDVLLRLMVGGRYSLGVAALGALLSSTLGLLMGLWTGLKPGWLDDLVGAGVDLLLGLPLVALMLILAALDYSRFGLGFFQDQPLGQVLRLGLLFGILDWMATQRVVRAHTRREVSLAYAEASRACGAGTGWVLLRAVLPSLRPVLWINGSFLFARLLVAESTLSYLGMGISPPTPTWGNMLKAAQEYFLSAPLLAVLPGLFLMSAALGLTLMATGAKLKPGQG